MKIPDTGTRRDTAVRAVAKAQSRRIHPFGKALARIQYFEQQRGLSLTHPDEGHIRTPPISSVRGTARRAALGRLAYEAAHQGKALLAPSFEQSANLPVWRELGPETIPHGQSYGTGGNNKPPVSGRCAGIFIDPTDRRHLVLCSAGGGLWGSNDAGATWRPLTDRQPTLAMGAIACAPSSPNIVYAGTGEGDTRSPLGMGILRSSDGGRTWTHLASPALAATGIYDIAVDPDDPMHLWVAAVAGLFESKDGAATFRALRRGLTWDVSAVAGEVLAATESGLLRSKDGGATWSAVALAGAPSSIQFDRMEVCHAPSSAAVVYVAAAAGGHAMLWRRATAAGSFAVQKPPAALDSAKGVAQAWYDWCLAVAPDDPDVLYWGAIELFRGARSASGWRWTNISSRAKGDSIHPDQHHLQFDPSDPQTLYACNDGGVFRSPDGGTRWESLNVGLGISEFEFLAQLEKEDSWLIGGTQDNGTLSDANNAKSWDQVALGDGGDCGAADGSPPQCYHSYYGMWIERAPATGSRAFAWQDASPPVPEDPPYPALFYPPMDVRGTVVSKAGCTVFVSADSGSSWAEVQLPTSADTHPDIASALTLASGTLLLLGTVRGAVYTITKGRGDWKNAKVAALASPRNGFISDLVAVGAGAKTLWASCSMIGGSHVFQSVDGGSSWSDRTGNLPDVPVNAIVVDPADNKVVYAATDNGVYRTDDAGAHWTSFSNGLPNAVVGDLILHERRRVLRAGTRNRGAWEVSI